MKLKIGSKLPNSEFFYLDDKNEVQKINTGDIFKNQKIILLGMPGAFTKTCSAKHLPSFINNYEKAKSMEINKIVCVSVNDPNVMKAWAESHKANDKIFMASDPFCKFTKSIGAEVDKTEKGLGIRSSRYTMLIDNEIARTIVEEEDTAACDLTAAENFLKKLKN